MRSINADPVRGKTLHFTFDDGPMAGKTFEHRFTDDGTVSYHAVGGDKADPPSKPVTYEFAQINDDIYVVAYLGAAGYTLTSVLDYATGHLTGFASNATSLVTQHGRFATPKQPAS
ncbi:MAG: MoaF N-terminal domain-containing protein [Deltaproteobacteria bacterium]|nr:MoaF N-terminal domain-containing protein [Deltaproteobacteria bacterium]